MKLPKGGAGNAKEGARTREGWCNEKRKGGATKKRIDREMGGAGKKVMAGADRKLSSVEFC